MIRKVFCLLPVFNFLLCETALAIHKPDSGMERIYELYITNARKAHDNWIDANSYLKKLDDGSEKKAQELVVKRYSDEIKIEFNKAAHVAMKAYGMDDYRQASGVAVDPQASAYKQRVQFTPVYVEPLPEYNVRENLDNGGFQKREIDPPEERKMRYAEQYDDGSTFLMSDAFMHGMGFLAATIHHEHAHFINSITPGKGDVMVKEEDEKDAYEQTQAYAEIFGLKEINLNAGTARPFYSALEFVQHRLEQEDADLKIRFAALKKMGCNPEDMSNDCRHVRIGGLDKGGKYPLKAALSSGDLAEIRALDAQAEKDVASEFIERDIAKKILARARELGNKISARQEDAGKDREKQAAQQLLAKINSLGNRVEAKQAEANAEGARKMEARHEFLQGIRDSADSCGFDVADIENGVFRRRGTHTQIGFPYKFTSFNSAEQAAVVNIGLMLTNACMNRDPGWFESACNDGMDDVARYWDRLNPGKLSALLPETDDSDLRSCVNYLIWYMKSREGRNSGYGNIKDLVRQYEDTYHPKAAPSSGSSNTNTESPSNSNNIDRGNNGGGWEGRPLHLKTLPQIMHGL